MAFLPSLAFFPFFPPGAGEQIHRHPAVYGARGGHRPGRRLRRLRCRAGGTFGSLGRPGRPGGGWRKIVRKIDGFLDFSWKIINHWVWNQYFGQFHSMSFLAESISTCEVWSVSICCNFWERTVLKCLDFSGWPKAVERMLRMFWPISTWKHWKTFRSCVGLWRGQPPIPTQARLWPWSFHTLTDWVHAGDWVQAPWWAKVVRNQQNQSLSHLQLISLWLKLDDWSPEENMVLWDVAVRCSKRHFMSQLSTVKK